MQALVHAWNASFWPYLRPAMQCLAGLIFLAALISTIITIDQAIEGRNRQKDKP